MKTNPPWQSKLTPYLDEIRELRQHRKTYTKISAILLENHDLKVSASTIFNVVKVRARRAGPYALPPPKLVPIDSGSTSSDAIEKLRGRPGDKPLTGDNPLALLLAPTPLVKNK